MRCAPRWALISLDVKNAFNSVDRVAVLECVRNEPALCHLYPLMYSWMSVDADLHLGSDMHAAAFRSTQGVHQGAGDAMFGFSLVLHTLVEELNRRLQALRAYMEARFFADDGYMFVNPAQPGVAPVLEWFHARCRDLSLERADEKEVTYCPALTRQHWQPDLAAMFPREGAFVRDGGRRAEAIQDLDNRGLKVQRVPVGTEKYVELALRGKAEACVSKVNEITRQLRSRCLHALWSVLHFCCSTLLHHWLQLCPPDSMVEAATLMDTALLQAAGVAVPALGAVAVVDPLLLRRLRQPCRLSGCGLRSCVELRDATFIGGVELAVPWLADFSPLCALAVGTDFEHQHYAPLTSDGVRALGVALGDEVADAWARLRGVAGVAPDAEHDPNNPLTAPATRLVSAGGGVDRVQHDITVVLEDHRQEQLLVDMRALPIGHSARLAFENVDRFSSQWVTSWIGNGGGLSNFEFEVATAWYLGLPIPCLAPYLGQPIGNTGRVVDAHGFALTCAPTTGDDWSIAHDGYLAVLADELRDMGVHTATEVTGLFRSCIPDPVQRARFQEIPRRQRRGMVPDMRASLVGQDGATTDRLLELKFIHVCPTRYSAADAQHPARCRSVER